jgi:hypothetical protein
MRQELAVAQRNSHSMTFAGDIVSADVVSLSFAPAAS